MKIKQKLLLLLSITSISAAIAADWPMWRYNPGHTAETKTPLPESLHLQWRRDLDSPSPAWPKKQTKLRFDVSYEPVASENIIFMPSMGSDNVTAYDSFTGEEIWRFYTDGPVRFAPLVYKTKLFFVSDDGFLYCLNKKSGKLIYRKLLAPSKNKIIGNKRIISTWPVRGAPVLYDRKLYVSAGIWPFMGIFIYCIDAETGKTVWCNSGSGSIYIKQQHNSPAFAGVAPQGYMTIAGNVLLVPGGRTVPAAYNRHTGDFLYYHLSSRQASGDYAIAAQGEYFFNGEYMYISSNGNELYRNPAGVLMKDRILFVSKPSKNKKLCFLSANKFTTNKKTIKRRGKQVTVDVPVKIWRAKLPENSGKLFLKAGNRLFCGNEKGKLFAFDLNDRPENDSAIWQPDWKESINGSPWSMIAADNRLFVVTEQGILYCFGAEKTSLKTYSQRNKPLPASDESMTKTVQRIIKQLPDKKGYCVAFGLYSESWIKELLKKTDLHILVIEKDNGKIREFRKELDAAGLYGKRITVLNSKISDLPPYFASLVISKRLPKNVRKASRDIFRILRPYGGAAYFLSYAPKQEAFKRAVDSLNFPSLKTTIWNDGLIRMQRIGSLPGSASWTHQYADSGNTVVSKDKLVKLPLGILWFGGASNEKILPRHGHGPTPQVVNGRIFIEGPDIIRALDVYTGRVLWEKEIKNFGKFYNNTSHHPGANKIGSNYVSMPDAIYAITPEECQVMDPKTGKTIKKLTIPGNTGRQNWGFIAVSDKYLIAATTPIKIDLSRKNKRKKNKKIPETIIIRQNAKWNYSVGSKEPNWNLPGFKMSSKWKSGTAGFGYGDSDDKTEFKDMHGKATAAYIRKSFDVADIEAISELVLMIRYDDGFIAYLNGREVARANIKISGPKLKVSGHEAGKSFDSFKIKDFKKLLKKRENVLAIEGHNASIKSSDFTLDPHLVAESDKTPTEPINKIPEKKSFSHLKGVTVNADYASASQNITIIDRYSGKILWTRKAQFNFRHNAIIAGNGKLFCIDSISAAKLAFLKRRGYSSDKSPVLYAFDLETGKELWKTEKNIFGTWLGYSADYNILIQAGSASWDRASDESENGIAAYDATTGKLLWKNKDRSNGPCMLHKNRVLTQRTAYELQTGKTAMMKNPFNGKDIPWRFKRNYGCNTAIASEHLLTFRSAAAGYFDLDSNVGTGNLGGFKSGCTSNLIPADGVLNAPDYTKTCTCSYQNQSSIALIHTPGLDSWTFTTFPNNGKIKRMGINFGAPGDKFSETGTLWLEYPVVGGPSPAIPISVSPENHTTFRQHSSMMKNSKLKWVAASGIKGVEKIELSIPQTQKCDIRLCFAEPDYIEKGKRVFSVIVNGQTALEDFDILKAAGQRSKTLIKTFKNINVDDGTLTIIFKPSKGKPIISGIEIIAK